MQADLVTVRQRFLSSSGLLLTNTKKFLNSKPNKHYFPHIFESDSISMDILLPLMFRIAREHTIFMSSGLEIFYLLGNKLQT